MDFVSIESLIGDSVFGNDKTIHKEMGNDGINSFLISWDGLKKSYSTL